MLGAGARFAPWLDLATIRDVASQPSEIFVVDLGNVIDAKRADLPSVKAAIIPARSWTARRSTRTGTSIVS
jgi:hypothetical protein